MLPPILLVTRPLDAGRRLVADLRADGWDGTAQLAPLVRLDPIDPGPLPDATGLILSSEEAAARAAELGLGHLPAWCVGPRTAVRAARAGARVEMAPDAEQLVARMASARPGGLWLHLHGRETTRDAAGRDLVTRLAAVGIMADGRVAYGQTPLPLDRAARALWVSDTPLVVPVLSPNGAARLVDATGGPRVAPVHLVAISQAVARQAAALQARSVDIAVTPDGAGLRDAIRVAWERAAGATG